MFHILLLEHDTLKKGWVDKMFQPKLDRGDSKGYEFEAIFDNKVYAKKSDNGHLIGLYYLFS